MGADKRISDFDKVDKEMDYEEKRMPSRQIIVWLVGLLGSLIAIMALMFVLYGAPQAQPQGELVTTRKMLQPALQANPAKTMKKFKQEQLDQLSSYGWVDKGQGVVRIPIEAAMDLAVKKGLFPKEGGKN